MSEVTTPALRTTLSGGISGAYNLGMLLAFASGALARDAPSGWRWVAAGSSALPLGGFALLLLAAPESPAWLVTRGREGEARRALRWLRGPGAEVEEEMEILRKSYADARKREKAAGADAKE